MIDALANFHFLRPAWLLLAPLAVGLWILWIRNAEPLRGWRAQMDSELLRALVVGEKSNRDYAPYWLLAGWLIATCAIAGPTWKLEPNPFASDAQPLFILLKADASMDHANPPPSLLERAQLKIADLAKARRGQPLGLIAYAGSAHLVLPPTRDTDVVAQMASDISPEIMPVAGDRLDLAISKASELLHAEESGGSILVIADSVQGDPKALPAALAEAGHAPIQFLTLANADSPEAKTIRDAADALNADVQAWTVDDEDVASITRFAERAAGRGVAGEGDRWHEAGYWLTPLIALIAALSFRRRELAATEGQT